MSEAVFVNLAAAELQRHFWRQRVFDVEIARGSGGAEGYDLVVTRGDIVRHVALLTRPHDRVDDVWISEKLAHFPSGCVVQLVIDDDLNIVRWNWFGGRPGEPLPAGSKRPKIRRKPPERPDAPPEMGWQTVRQPPPGMRELRFVDFEGFETSDGVDWVAQSLVGRFHAPDDIAVALKDVTWREQRYETWSDLQFALKEGKDCTVTAELNNASDHGSIKVQWGDSWVSYIVRLDEEGRWRVDDTAHFGVHRA